MLKRICDRCGAEALERPTGFILHNKDRMVDLCEKCDKELNLWANNKYTYVVDPSNKNELKFAETPVINYSWNDKKKVGIDLLPEYFTISKKEYARLWEKEQTLRRIIDIIYCDDMDYYDKVERILCVL